MNYVVEEKVKIIIVNENEKEKDGCRKEREINIEERKIGLIIGIFDGFEVESLIYGIKDAFKCIIK